MPLAAVAVLLGDTAKETVVVKDGEATLRLLPLGEAAVGAKDLGDRGHPLLQGSAAYLGSVLAGQAVGQAAEEKGGLLVWAKPLKVAGRQAGDLLQQCLGQAVVVPGKGILSMTCEPIYVMRPSSRPANGLSLEQVVTLEGREVLADSYGGDAQLLGQFIDSAAAVALDEGEDEAFRAVQSYLRYVAPITVLVSGASVL